MKRAKRRRRRGGDLVFACVTVKPASLYVRLPASTRMKSVDEGVNSLELKTSFFHSTEN